MPVLPGTRLKPGRRKKKEWSKCSDCGTEDGYVRSGLKTPIRINGSRFGIDGDLCWSCYDKHNKRRVRAGRETG